MPHTGRDGRLKFVWSGAPCGCALGTAAKSLGILDGKISSGILDGKKILDLSRSCTVQQFQPAAWPAWPWFNCFLPWKETQGRHRKINLGLLLLWPIYLASDVVKLKYIRDMYWAHDLCVAGLVFLLHHGVGNTRSDPFRDCRLIQSSCVFCCSPHERLFQWDFQYLKKHLPASQRRESGRMVENRPMPRQHHSSISLMHDLCQAWVSWCTTGIGGFFRCVNHWNCGC